MFSNAYTPCSGTCVLSELHHSLHGLRVGQRHEPEELRPPAAFMEIHLYGLLFLFEHLKAATEARLKHTLALLHAPSVSTFASSPAGDPRLARHSPVSAAGGQPVHVVLVQHAQRRQGQPQLRGTREHVVSRHPGGHTRVLHGDIRTLVVAMQRTGERCSSSILVSAMMVSAIAFLVTLDQPSERSGGLTAAMSLTSLMMISAICGGVEPFIHQWLSPRRM
ncbi:hypothetical protein EYF80_025283 [Liparis tanakae]|uniref:Uncharacterized protein n=1 Tax=Liparis tanakae TaxID=230148 RepID=A0A4Z2HH00_9TELE|nr:hypothetical protein EYF80_025283 [Liparis tanakae]